MHYLVFVVGAGGMLMFTRSIYNRFERWNRSRRLRGPRMSRCRAQYISRSCERQPEGQNWSLIQAELAPDSQG